MLDVAFIQRDIAGEFVLRTRSRTRPNPARSVKSFWLEEFENVNVGLGVSLHRRMMRRFIPHAVTKPCAQLLVGRLIYE